MKIVFAACLMITIQIAASFGQEIEEEARVGCIKEICPLNEKYKCCGTCYQQTCAQEDRICPDVCYQGCYCIKGYVRSSPDGRCIPIKKCRPTIPTVAPTE
uniref:TIL domain-containing protein n=1 Tax=Anopheles albimanus TaxID=7167 RepID=A0A8W7K3U0_ANOAL